MLASASISRLRIYYNVAKRTIVWICCTVSRSLILSSTRCFFGLFLWMRLTTLKCCPRIVRNATIFWGRWCVCSAGALRCRSLDTHKRTCWHWFLKVFQLIWQRHGYGSNEGKKDRERNRSAGGVSFSLETPAPGPRRNHEPNSYINTWSDRYG